LSIDWLRLLSDEAIANHQIDNRQSTMHRLIVFDLDGTLVDSRRDLAEAANATLAEFGGGPLPEDDIGRMVGDGARMLVARAFGATRIPQPPEALDRFLAIYNARLLVFTLPYPGVLETLAVLSPHATLAVLTNKPRAPALQILAGLDLARYFLPAHVVGGDGPFPRKPDPAGLRHLVAASGVSPVETLLVGDSAVDWETARRAGTRVCLARYGFGFENLREAPPDDVMAVDRFADLAALAE
jgi:phosphoglycolate phosphatase